MSVENIEIVFVKLPNEGFSPSYEQELGKLISENLSKKLKRKVNVIVTGTSIELISKKDLLYALEKYK